MNYRTRALFAVTFAVFFIFFTGCRSHHIEITVENRTGSAIRLLEVDYPNASFGADSVGAGSVLRYRIQVQGSGPVKVQYTAADGHQAEIAGPTLSEGQEGTLRIVLLPGDKAEFR
jgi:hypothetical protein